MTPKFSLVAIPVLAGLALVPAAWGNHQYGDASYQAEPVTARVSPDAVDRALAANLALQPNLNVSPDAFERAVATRNTTGRSLVFDNHRLTEPTNTNRRLVGDNYREPPKTVSRPAPTAASDSGREIKWPQIGMGFGLGILLAIGLFLAMRYTRIRPLAH